LVKSIINIKPCEERSGWHGGDDQSFDLGRCSEPPMIAVRYTYQNGAL
jgi:hypothetical protein